MYGVAYLVAAGLSLFSAGIGIKFYLNENPSSQIGIAEKSGI